MALYDDAKLIFLASAAAGKETDDGSKAYCVKPTNGNGDFTISRTDNLNQTRVGPTGLIEKGRENLLLQSNAFGTTWTSTDVSESIGQTGYDGTTNAWLVTKTASTNSALRQNFTSFSGIRTFSVHAKAGTLNGINIQARSSGTTHSAQFDLSDGTTGSDSNEIVSNISFIGNGWYRCSIAFNASSVDQVRIFVCTDGSTVGSTAGTILIQDSQLEAGLVATDVITTGASTATAGIKEDEPRFDYPLAGGVPSLLLEPQRQNLITHSEYFGAWSADGTATLTSNQITSPEGVTNAALLDYGASPAGPDRVSIAPTIDASTAYSFSVFAKKKDASKIQLRNFHSGNDAAVVFDLDAETASVGANADSGKIENYGNGWYRCTMNFTSDSGDTQADLRIGAPNTYSDSEEQIYIYGAQLEEGAFATSYIPTHGAAATRSLDGIPRIPSGTSTDNVVDLSSSFTGDDITLVFELTENPSVKRDNSSGGIRLSNGDSQSGAIRVYRNSGSAVQNRIVFFGTSADSFGSGVNNDSLTLTSSSPKVAISRVRSTGVFTIYVDGSALANAESLTDGNGQFTNANFDVTWDDLQITGQGGIVKLSKLMLFDSALSGANMAKLTS